ncbi:MAG: polyprenyl diphosphate synthase [Bacteroidales bacterium]|nr:polyprenyl diphosphate synthase [Bacteroidales bacterium]
MTEENKRIPSHVSIIMDGNGRWAAQRGRERVFGHAAGVESVRAVVEASVKAGVRYLSLYAFSEENWGRPEAEVTRLMSLMVQSMRNEIDSLDRNGVHFVVLGNRSRLSDEINRMIDECDAKTAHNDRLTLMIMLSYSGKWDILEAAKSLVKEALDDPEKGRAMADGLSAEDFASRLVTSGYPDPDLIIRTSGEKRLSNYFLWQGAYSEFYFTDVLWPDFREKEFFDAVEDYSRRDRRYGKVK